MTVLNTLISSLTRLTGGAPAMPTAVAPLGATPLTAAPVGVSLCLVEVGAAHKVAHRLAELGLTVGVSLTVLQNAGGPLLLAVRDSRIALGRDVAEQLQVKPELSHE